MKQYLRPIIVAVTVGVAAWYVFRSVDVNQLMGLLRTSNVGLLVAAIPVILFSHLVRALRWRRLLTGVASAIPLTEAFGAVMLGYAASTVVPRSGEILRPLQLSRRTSVPVAASLASIVVERVLDVLALLVGILILLLVERERVFMAIPAFDPMMLLTGLLLPVAVAIGLLVLIAFTAVVPRFIVGSAATLNKRLAVRVRTMLATVRQGAMVLRNAGTWPAVVLETMLMWFLYAIPIWFVVVSMPMNIGAFSFVDAGVLLMIITIGISIAPTPGALGVYHGFAQTALMRLYSATPDEGLGFALLAWTLNYGVALVVGGIWFLVDQRRK